MATRAQTALAKSEDVLADFFRSPLGLLRLPTPTVGVQAPGFFRFGERATCYGATSITCPSSPDKALPDLLEFAQKDSLPFDPVEVVNNLQKERYPPFGESILSTGLARAGYYKARPFLPDVVRKSLQRLYFRGWKDIPFPSWPVDTSVEHFRAELLQIAMRRAGLTRVPFVWFWPNGARAAAIMTHDVEAQAGLEFVPTLLGIDAEFDVPTSYQLVPQARYQPPPGLLDLIRAQGAEVNVHDLTHAGNLFSSRQKFLRQVPQINEVARVWGSDGFRAACMYRNADWLEDLTVSYDMSVPNVAHLEPQRGGCCTVFPYFIGNLVELPLTMTQDFSLFRMLRTYSPDLWEQQIEIILEQHGLMSFITHPDYLEAEEPLRAYRALLRRITSLRDQQNVWVTTPGQVARWWRDRRDTIVVERDGHYALAGPAQAQARLAYASIHNGRLRYELA